MESKKKDVVVLFRLGSYSFALSKEFIEQVTKCLPIVDSCSLPKIFSGFFSFGQIHLPCLRLDWLIGHEDFMSFNPEKSSQVVILRPNMKNSKNKLGVLIDDVEATFVPRRDQLKPLRKELKQNKWLQGEILFGEKSYLLINQDRLFQSIEDYCLAEISNHSAL